MLLNSEDKKYRLEYHPLLTMVSFGIKTPLIVASSSVLRGRLCGTTVSIRINSKIVASTYGNLRLSSKVGFLADVGRPSTSSI
jgi:hypothetical protein